MAYIDRHERRKSLESVGNDTLLALSIATPIALLVFLILQI